MEDNKDSEKYSFPTSSKLLKKFSNEQRRCAQTGVFYLFYYGGFYFSGCVGVSVGLGSPVCILLYKREFVKNGGC